MPGAAAWRAQATGVGPASSTRLVPSPLGDGCAAPSPRSGTEAPRPRENAPASWRCSPAARRRNAPHDRPCWLDRSTERCECELREGARDRRAESGESGRPAALGSRRRSLKRSEAMAISSGTLICRMGRSGRSTDRAPWAHRGAKHTRVRRARLTARPMPRQWRARRE